MASHKYLMSRSIYCLQMETLLVAFISLSNVPTKALVRQQKQCRDIMVKTLQIQTNNRQTISKRELQSATAHT